MFYRMLIVRPLVCFLLLTGALGSWATRSALAQDLWPRESLPATSRLQVNGFYRFAATYLDEKVAYPRFPDQVSTLPGRQIFVGDDAQLPNLWLNIKGKPGGNLSWSFDIYAFQFLNGRVGAAYSGPVANAARPSLYDPLSSARLANSLGMNLGMNLALQWSDRRAAHQLRIGGIHWYSLSDLTLASFRGYFRWSLFERNPWDPVTRQPVVRYDDLYRSGQFEQDVRFGERAVHGAIWDVLPKSGRIKASVFAGKTEMNAGLGGLASGTFGGRFQHKLTSSGAWLAVNSLNHRQFLDSSGSQRTAYGVHTLEGRTAPGKAWEIRGEMGLGRYQDPVYQGSWSELASVKVLTRPALTGIPLELHAYRIGRELVNNNGLYWNVAVQERGPALNTNPTAGASGANAVLRPFASAVVPLGLMTNNRQGLNLNTRWQTGPMRWNLGIGMAREISPVSNRITFNHPINQFTRARFWRWNFPQNVGPYGRQSVIYRDVFETVKLSDDSAGIPVHAKHFSTLEAQIAWKTEGSPRPLYVFYLARLNSVQKNPVPVVDWRPTAYLRQYAHELESYWAVSPRWVLCAYAAAEWTLGNYATDLDLVTFKPRDQRGHALGLGADWHLGPQSALYFRHRWYGFNDRSFAQDQFRGTESWVELKVFF